MLDPVRQEVIALAHTVVVKVGTNENDTVSVAEIKFGDNDHLAAMVTNLLQAPLLVLLSVVDGLFTADPTVDAAAQPIATVPLIDGHVMEKAGATRSALGSGGM